MTAPEDTTRVRPTIRRGDRVRVTVEGDVRESGPLGFWIGGSDAAPNFIAPSAAHVVSVEVIEPPKPPWTAGDVVKTEWGTRFLQETGHGLHWVDGGGQRQATGADFYDHLLNHTVKALVRGGKIVGGTE